MPEVVMRGDAQGGLSSLGFHKLSRRWRIFLESWKTVMASGSLRASELLKESGSLRESTWCWLISEDLGTTWERLEGRGFGGPGWSDQPGSVFSVFSIFHLSSQVSSPSASADLLTCSPLAPW